MMELAKKPVWVEWVDSKQSHGWWKPGETGPNELGCITLGFLVREDEEAIHVADSVCETGSAGCVMAIPRCSIKELRYVTWPGDEDAE